MESRKMSRRITATLLAAILVASSSVAVFGQDGEVVLNPAESMLMDEQMQAAPESEDIILTAEQLATIPPSTAEFEIDTQGVLTKYKGSGGDVVIPNGVTSIGNMAFYFCTGLTSVTIPNSVTSIGGWAFDRCTGLTSVTIPNSVTSIGEYVFRGCTGLTNITVDAGNANYSSEDGVLYNKDKTILGIFPAGKKGGFIIPNTVTSIGESTFKGCTGLTSVTIPNSVTSIGESAFYECTGLTSVTIPNSVKSIGMSAFKGCTGLTSVTIPNSVTSIDYNAFYGCGGLTSVTIPNSVTSIGYNAFYNCKGLTNITVDAGNANYSSEDGVLYNKDKTVLFCFPTGKKGRFIIPNSVTSIDVCAFDMCTGLTGVTIPNSVTSIGTYAFARCTGLTSVTIPNSVTIIEAWAFCDCTGLTSVTIPNSVTSIGRGAFESAPSLTIYGDKGSYAKTYANENGIPFKIIEAQKPADLDGSGEVNLTDLMSVLHGVSNRATFTQEQSTIADVTHDGKVDINDLMKILHFVSKRIPSLD